MAEFISPEKEALERIWQALNLRFPIVSFLLSVALLLKIFFKIPFSNYLFILISVIPFSAIGYGLVFSKIKKPALSQILNGYFLLICFDALILTAIIYFLGGVSWIGFVFYAFYFYSLFILLPKNYCYFYFAYCTFLYSLLVLFQFLGFLPYQNIFGFEEKLYQKQSFVLTSLIAAVATLWSLGYFGDFPYKVLGRKIGELQNTSDLLEKERASLAEKIRERTRELELAKESLEEKVKERTKELQEKVSELERFYKAVVGRELKMKELKEELEKLKKKEK